MAEIHFPLQSFRAKVLGLRPSLTEEHIVEKFLTRRGSDPDLHIATRVLFEVYAVLDEETGKYCRVSHPHSTRSRYRKVLFLEHFFPAFARNVQVQGVNGLSKQELIEDLQAGAIRTFEAAELVQNTNSVFIKRGNDVTLETQGELHLRYRSDNQPYVVERRGKGETLWHVRYMTVKQETKPVRLSDEPLLPALVAS